MGNIENNPFILSVKADLREMFLAILNTLAEAFRAFYDWLRNVPMPMPPTMLKLFGNNKANLILFVCFVIYLLYINIRAYLLFAHDKKQAQRSKERIPERKLFMYMWLGGAVGAAAAMAICRHKTQHKNFVVTAAVLLAIQLLLYSFVLGFLGFWTFF